METRTTVGFIGLGLMGKPMARNILKAGFALTVYDRIPEAVAALAADGAVAAGSSAEVARASEFVITCLPGPAEVEQAYLGPAGVIEGVRPNAVLINVSTIDPDTHRKAAAAAAERGAHYLDAPMSGNTAGAQNGTLTFMVGGDAAALERARPVLLAVGQRIYHLGAVGSGAVAKLINNMLGASNAIAMAEGLVLGVKAGLDPALLLEVIGNSTGASRQLAVGGPNILKRNFEPGFMVDLMRKDLGLAVDLGKSLGVRLLMGSLASQVYQEAQSAGHGRKSHLAVIIPLENNAGVEVRE